MQRPTLPLLVALASCTILVPGVDGSLGFSHDPFYYDDPAVSWTYHVSNLGDTDGPAPIEVKIETSPGIGYVDAAAPWVCTTAPPTLIKCLYDDPLPAGSDIADLELTLSVGPQQIVRDVAKMCAELIVDGDVNPGNNGGCEEVPVHVPTAQYDLEIAKSVWTPIGSIAPYGSYLLEITNNGPDPVNDVITMTDTVPSPLVVTGVASSFGVSCGISGGNTAECTRSYLGVGQTITLTVVTDVDPSFSGVVENCASVFAPQDTNPANDEACISTTVNGPPPFDLQVTASTYFAPSPGSTGAYLFDIFNTGPNTATGPLDFDVDLPADATYASWTGTHFLADCPFNPATPDVLPCTLPNVSPGAHEQFVIWFTADDPSPDLEACGTVDSLGDIDAANNTDCVDANSPLPATPWTLATTMYLPGEPTMGDLGTATSVVSNRADAPVDVPLVHAFTLSPGTTFIGPVQGSGWSCHDEAVDDGSTAVTCLRSRGIPGKTTLDPLEIAVRYGQPGTASVCGTVMPGDDDLKDNVACGEVQVRGIR